MIIFDNIIFALQKAGGISIVWQNLIKNCDSLSHDLFYIDYGIHENIFRETLNIDPLKVIPQASFHPVFSQLEHPKISQATPFIFHSSYFRTCSNPNAINVTTVHDFIYEQGKLNLKQKLRIKLNYKAIRKSDAIVCISQNTKKDLLKYLPEIDPNKIRIIYNGVSEDYKILDDTPYPEYKDSVLYVGGRQGYKNFDFLVKTLAATKWNLIICGQSLTAEESTLLNKHLFNRFRVIQFPSNDELNKIYNSVFALVYPSSYEGFGIPVLEAQRAGCPVIALNSSSIPEVIGETPLLMNNLTSEELLSKLDYIKDSNQRKHIIEAGLKNSKRFSWKKMSQEYYNLYQELLTKRLNHHTND